MTNENEARPVAGMDEQELANTEIETPVITFPGDVKVGMKALQTSMEDAFANGGSQVFADCCAIQHLFDSIADPDERIEILSSQLDDVNKELGDKIVEVAELLDRVAAAEAGNSRGEARPQTEPLDVASGLAHGEAFPDEAAHMADLQHSNGLQAEELERQKEAIEILQTSLTTESEAHTAAVKKKGEVIDALELGQKNLEAALEEAEATNKLDLEKQVEGLQGTVDNLTAERDDLKAAQKG